MGIFKGMKDMKDMLGAAPGLLDQANQLSANAQVMQQQAAANAAVVGQTAGQPAGAMYGAGGPPVSYAAMPAELSEPIAGVDLATYAQISAGLADYNYDQTKAADLAAARGIDASMWQIAMEGWNGRIAANPAVARQFNALYTGRA